VRKIVKHTRFGWIAAAVAAVPNIPRANTNLTCIMIGERIAKWMR
jgi:hypothetical protein